tara:strand:+ start:1645 stop:2781 length:1137 start_codon:yes stop_codon:yes gene_type:complete
MLKKVFLKLILINFIYSACSDLDYDTCLQYLEYCEWNDQTSQCQDIGENENSLNYGPFQYDTFNEADGLIDSGSYFGATVFHPIDGEPPYSSIVIVPGAFSSELILHDWGSYFASYGFIAMTIGINDYYNDDMSDLAFSLLGAIDVLIQENNRLESPILNKVNIDNFATSGWSIGGGAAQYAATLDSSLKAVIALNPGLAIQDYENCTDPTYEYYCLHPEHLNHSSPVLIISSEGDIENPTETDAVIHYEYTPESTFKMLFELENGSHGTGLDPSAGYGELGEKVIQWLNHNLLDNSNDCDLLTNIPTSAAQFMTNLECQDNDQGDLNNDQVIDVLDIIVLVNFIINPEIFPIDGSDLNNDGILDILDIVLLVNIILN